MLKRIELNERVPDQEGRRDSIIGLNVAQKRDQKQRA